MDATKGDEAIAAAESLNKVAADLDHRGITAKVLKMEDRPTMWVQNPEAKLMSDQVYAGPAEDGSWWLWWSWDARIAPIEETRRAARTIESVLTPE